MPLFTAILFDACVFYLQWFTINFYHTCTYKDCTSWYKPVSVRMDSLLDDRNKMDMLHMNNHRTIHKNDSQNQNLCQKE